MGDNSVSRVAAVSLQTYYKVEKSLIWIRFAFLTHIIGRCFIEMQASNSDFRYLVLLQFKSEIDQLQRIYTHYFMSSLKY